MLETMTREENRTRQLRIDTMPHSMRDMHHFGYWSTDPRIAYRELRRKGWKASAAIGSARIRASFAEYEDDTVRLRIAPDDDASFALDFDCCTSSATTRSYGLSVSGEEYKPCIHVYEHGKRAEGRHACAHKCEAFERAECDGMWGIIGEYRDPFTGEWEHADSVWGFIGDDWQDSGYDDDVRQETLDAYQEAVSKAAMVAFAPSRF